MPDGPTARRAAAVQPESWSDDDRGVDVIWTTGAAVTRLDYLDGAYYDETLATDTRSVRLDRLNAGGPVLLDHVGLTGALAGSIVPGSARMEGGRGVARIRFADTPDVADAVAKVKAGRLRSVSVGYLVHTYQRRDGLDGGRDELRAVDWEPTEISLTPVPADPGACIRSTKEAPMPEIIEDDTPIEARRTTPGKAISVDRIRDACARGDYSRAFEREVLEEHAERPFTARSFQERLTGEYARMKVIPQPLDNNDFRTTGTRGQIADGMAGAVEDALYARLSGKAPAERARQFMGASMNDMAKGVMEARGMPVRWDPPARIMQRFGAHTVSDFPNLLQNATSRYLLDLYAAMPAPLKVLARSRLVPDFRIIKGLSMLAIGTLPRVDENAEFKRISIREGTNGYRLATYGAILSVSRQAYVNDDLHYFQQMATVWSRGAAELEATQLAGVITGNGPVLDDNVFLYDPAHGNLSATGDAISVASLSGARLAMRSQKNTDGTPASVVPRYLVVGPARETEAQQVLATLNAVSQPSQVNPFSGTLELIVDPRLTGNSWRLFADPAIWPVIEYAQLQGQEGVFTDTRIGFDIDGFDWKARLDFGAGPVDWRGAFKSPGN